MWVLLKCKALTVDWLSLLLIHPSRWVLNLYPPLFQILIQKGTKGMRMDLTSQEQPKMPYLLPTVCCCCWHATCCLRAKQIAAKHDCMHPACCTGQDPHAALSLPSSPTSGFIRWDMGCQQYPNPSTLHPANHVLHGQSCGFQMTKAVSWMMGCLHMKLLFISFF